MPDNKQIMVMTTVVAILLVDIVKNGWIVYTVFFRCKIDVF